MLVSKETWIEMGDELIYNKGEGLGEWPRGFQGGITNVY
jgi:hypothetical protein